MIWSSKERFSLWSAVKVVISVIVIALVAFGLSVVWIYTQAFVARLGGYPMDTAWVKDSAYHIWVVSVLTGALWYLWRIER